MDLAPKKVSDDELWHPAGLKGIQPLYSCGYLLVELGSAVGYSRTTQVQVELPKLQHGISPRPPSSSLLRIIYRSAWVELPSYLHTVWLDIERLARLLAILIDLCWFTSLVRAHAFDRRHLRRASSAMASRRHLGQVAVVLVMLLTPAVEGNAQLKAEGSAMEGSVVGGSTKLNGSPPLPPSPPPQKVLPDRGDREDDDQSFPPDTQFEPPPLLSAATITVRVWTNSSRLTEITEPPWPLVVATPSGCFEFPELGFFSIAVCDLVNDAIWWRNYADSNCTQLVWSSRGDHDSALRGSTRVSQAALSLSHRGARVSWAYSFGARACAHVMIALLVCTDVLTHVPAVCPPQTRCGSARIRSVPASSSVRPRKAKKAQIESPSVATS